MVAEGADEVVGDGLALVDVAADRADPAGALGLGERLRRGLDVGAVVVVGHALVVGEDLALHDLGDEHAVAALIGALEHAAVEHGVDIAVRITKQSRLQFDIIAFEVKLNEEKKPIVPAAKERTQKTVQFAMRLDPYKKAQIEYTFQELGMTIPEAVK